MGNVKYENGRHVHNNVAIANNCWICQHINCKDLLIVSNLDIILSDLTSKRPSFFLVDLKQVFYEIFFGRKSLFHFFVIKVYYTFLQE